MIKHKGEIYHEWYKLYLMALIGLIFGFIAGYMRDVMLFATWIILISIITLIGWYRGKYYGY